MRTLIITVALMVSTQTKAQLLTTQNVHSFYHVTAGYGTGSLASMLGKTSKQRLIYSTTSAFAIGVGKEVFDARNGNKASISDIAFTTVGGVLSGLVTNWIYKKTEKRLLKKLYRKV